MPLQQKPQKLYTIHKVPITHNQIYFFFPVHAISPFQGSKVGKDLVAFVLHLAVDAVDRDLLDQSLQSSPVVLHARTRTDGETTSPLSQ